MNRTRIDWCDYTWNPVTGCRRNCWYCYVRRLPNYEKEPRFHPDRLNQPFKAKHKKIFVCSTADLFGPWIPDEWIENVVEVTKQNPQNIFLFLTKFPDRLKNFRFPMNCWLGTTVEEARYLGRIVYLNERENTKFVSFEPLLEDIIAFRKTGINAKDILKRIDWIIIGGLTGTPSINCGNTPIMELWIEKILLAARQLNIPVFIKDNAKYKERIKKFPEYKFGSKTLDEFL